MAATLRTHLYCAILGMAALLPALPCQQRRPVVGRVSGPDGAPVAGATVTLVWSPPGGEQSGPTDAVKVTTDPRGRFVAPVRAQEVYSAWALAGGDGAHTSSRVHDCVAAGADLELRLELPARRRRVQLAGAEAWAGIGPLRVQVVPRALRLVAFDLDADGASPPLPPIGLVLVRDAAGGVLHAEAAPPGADDAPLTVALPPPHTVRLLATLADGSPVAGAEVLHAASHHLLQRIADTDFPFDRPPLSWWRRAGVTAADGTAAVVVPAQQGQGWRPLLVRSAGKAECHLGPHPLQPGRVSIDGQWRQIDPSAPIRVDLHPAARLRLLHAGLPLRPADAVLAAAFRGPVPLDRGCELVPDADGTTALPIPANALETMLHVRARPDDPWLLARFPLANGELTTIDLAGLRSLSLQFLDEHGGPARGLTGVLFAVGSPHSTATQVPIATDQAGRIERMLGFDAWILFLTDGLRAARYYVPRADEPGSAREIRATVTCELLGSARMHVRDSKGKPVAGARVVSVDIVGSAGRPAALAGPGAQHFWALYLQTIPRLCRKPASDETGLLRVPVLPAPAPACRVQIRAQGHGVGLAVVEPGWEGNVNLGELLIDSVRRAR